jgi:hypothetical protein
MNTPLLNPSRLVAFLGACFLAGCAEFNQEAAPPAYVMDKNKFAQVLRDVALSESAANLNISDVRIEKTDSVYAFDPLRDNGVSRMQFDSSVAYYCRHPQQYKEVYEEVLRMLGELKRN